MDACNWCLLILVAVLFPASLAEAAATRQFNSLNRTDVQAAVADMRSESYHGFAILLQMLNRTSQPYRGLTFFMPGDPQLSASPISVDRLEDFLMSHAIPTTLIFNDLLHFPTGSIVPSGNETKMLTISNSGRANFFLNNAHIVTPNVCQNSYIRCHGIDAVIRFDKESDVKT